ncbi:MAG TPA: Kdo hydroxylase family protein [Bryobacteraceae bacterium]|jgi:hypothetical protein|nr:Kdo hydroxylase family protein [Bryobacteraceae bacterium]
MPAVAVAPGVNPYEVLECGGILVLPQAPFGITAEERALIESIRETGSGHKNIAYKPLRGEISGLDRSARAAREPLRAMLRRFSDAAVEWAAGLVPRYSGLWRMDYASLRPLEEAGRNLPFKKRNDLLHTDAFPTRPTGGGLILRIFWNLHRSRPRVWQTTDPFPVVARRYAAAAGLGRATQRGWFGRALLHGLGLPVKLRTPYDSFMLRFHDYLKANTEFQLTSPKYRMEFPAGAAWMVFTDVVPHAVESGQYAMEQTLIVPREALAEPERAPVSVLEAMCGRKLA